MVSPLIRLSQSLRDCTCLQAAVILGSWVTPCLNPSFQDLRCYRQTAVVNQNTDNVLNEYSSGIYEFGRGRESCSRKYGRPSASCIESISTNMLSCKTCRSTEEQNVCMLSKISQCYSVTNSTSTAAAKTGACVAE